MDNSEAEANFDEEVPRRPISSLEIGESEEQEVKHEDWRPRLRRQNRIFGLGLCMSFLLLGAAVVVLGDFYGFEDLTEDDFEAEVGEVGNDAHNGKIQELLDKQKGQKAGGIGGKHGLHGIHSKKNPYDQMNNFNSEETLNSLKYHNGTDAAKQALLDRLNRTKISGYDIPLYGKDIPVINDEKQKEFDAEHQDRHRHANTTREKQHTTNNNKQGGTTKNQQGLSQAAMNWLAAPVTLEDGIMYEIVEQLQHDKQAFTQGLTYANGVLYESTGLNGQSTVRILNPDDGSVVQMVRLDHKYFGEGMTFYNDKLIQITWKKQTGFVYNAHDIEAPPQEFTFETTLNEGWGITYDESNDELIVSDGSDYLHFWNPSDFSEKRRVQVTRSSGRPADRLNELEFWRGRVLANRWYEDSILVIDPATGVVEKEYDFSALWPKPERQEHGADVLNGISVSGEPDILYVTGKKWDRMFKIKLLP